MSEVFSHKTRTEVIKLITKYKVHPMTFLGEINVSGLPNFKPISWATECKNGRKYVYAHINRSQTTEAMRKKIYQFCLETIDCILAATHWIILNDYQMSGEVAESKKWSDVTAKHYNILPSERDDGYWCLLTWEFQI